MCEYGQHVCGVLFCCVLICILGLVPTCNLLFLVRWLDLEPLLLTLFFHMVGIKKRLLVHLALYNVQLMYVVTFKFE